MSHVVRGGVVALGVVAAMTVASGGRVGDRGNGRIQIFTQEGVFLEEWKQFGRPSGMWIDSNDVIYVAESQSDMTRTPGFMRGFESEAPETGR